MNGAKFKKGSTGYFLREVWWDGHVVDGYICKVQITKVKQVPCTAWQTLEIRDIEDGEIFNTYNDNVYKNKQDAKDRLYIELEASRRFSSDMLDRVTKAEKELEEQQ